MNYYNELDPKAAAWLRELVAGGLIPMGEVDTRSITDVTPDDLSGFAQCHFFAGIGGWAYALRLAGWDDDRPVWTGSCPCQPFSQAGRGLGTADARHLWPVFERLIAKCSPPVVFGEQVASKAGRDWLAGVRADLEALGYAVGGADLCAAGVGAPHIRQRLYWVADADSKRHTRERVLLRAKEGERPSSSLLEVAGCGTASGVGNTNDPRPQGRNERGLCANELSAWASGVALPCTDGKSRRIEPGSFPLAHGVSGRVGLLRGYGNAIVPQVAAEFIKAFAD